MLIKDKCADCSNLREHEAGRVTRRTRVNGDSTRQALLTAAISIWAERGPQAVTMHGVGERAGRTRGTVYHHFADRDELLRATKSHLEASLQDLFSEDPRVFGDPIDVVSGLIAESPDVMRSVFREVLDLGPRAHPLVRRAIRYFESLQRRGFVRPGVDPGDAALTVLSLWFGAMMTVSLVTSLRSRRDHARRYKGLFREVVYGTLIHFPADQGDRS